MATTMTKPVMIATKLNPVNNLNSNGLHQQQQQKDQQSNGPTSSLISNAALSDQSSHSPVFINNYENQNQNSCAASNNNISNTTATTSNTSTTTSSKLAKTITKLSYSNNTMRNEKYYSPSVLHKLDMRKRLELTNKILENRTLLNCMQIINFIDIYFDENEMCKIKSGSPKVTSSLQQSHMHLMDDFENNSSSSGTESSVTAAVIPTRSNSSSSDLPALSSKEGLLIPSFPCIVCATKFRFEQTFLLHLNRRSMMVRIFCLKCDAYKTFYNKCKLLYHVYSHKMNLFDAIYSSLKIEPIPVDKLFFSKEKSVDFDSLFFSAPGSAVPVPNQTEQTDVSGLAKTLQHHATTSSTSKVNTGFQIGVNDEVQIKIFLKRLLINKFMLYKCFICDAIFFDPKDLKQHYLKSQSLELNQLNSQQQQPKIILDPLDMVNTNKPVRYTYKQLRTNYKESFDKAKFKFLTHGNALNDSFANLVNQFSFKKLQFSTRCSMLASMNLISNNFKLYPDTACTSQQASSNINNNNIKKETTKPPYILICPECGLTFDSVTEMDNFRLHLIHDCLFLSKYDSAQIKCPALRCNAVFDNLQDTVAHWSSKHLLRLHQCSLCEKEGVYFIFDEPSSSNSNGGGEPLYPNSNDSQLLRQLLDVNNDDSNQANPSKGDTQMSQELIREINKHHYEKHRDQKVLLKLIFKCQCKSETSSSPMVMDDNGSFLSDECLFYEWKSCRKHIIGLLAKSINSLSCLICKELVEHEEYKEHLKQSHHIEKILVCPKCGPLLSETNFHSHMLIMHPDLNYTNESTSCYYKALKDHTMVLRNIFHLPSNFTVYQCVNCRLLFSPVSTFSHNCWNVVDENLAVSGGPTQSTTPNYFSPIFLEFNVNKLYEDRLNLINTAIAKYTRVNPAQLIHNKLNNDKEANASGENNSSKKIKLTEVVLD